MIFSWWRNLSVAKKLYGVVGVMALLIALELFTLLFAMDTLSSVRSFVGGEGMWSKYQKNAVHSLHRYVFTSDEKFYREYLNYLKVPLGDRKARLELEKPNPDMQIVQEGFVQGNIHPKDVPGLVKVILRFNKIKYVHEALRVWKEADIMIDDVIRGGESLHKMISKRHRDYDKIQATLNRIDTLNEELTLLENDFSNVLGEGSRWMEHLLMIILVLAVLTVESTGLLLTFRFSKHLSHTLNELTKTAEAVGQGNFDQVAPVNSTDELGQLAVALNKMSQDLKASHGEKQQAESANQVKTMFLASMSHEIRTPLGVIIGLAEILKERNLSANEHTKYVNTLDRTSKNLLRIINDILDISKVEAGHFKIEKTPFSLPELMSELKTMLEIQAEKNRNRLILETAGIPESEILSDKARLRQIIVNLVGNALKFTHEGVVTLTYGARSGELVVRVRDTGPGIPPEYRDRLFKPFSQVEEHAAKTTEGTGLGLVVSKRLAQAMGGDLVLDRTEVGKGSTFLLTLPLELKTKPATLPAPEIKRSGEATPAPEAEKAPPVVPPAPQAVTNELQGVRILVAEDSKDNQLLVRLFLAKFGVHLDFADNGEEAVQKAMRGDCQIVLMDIQMPVMDGYTATRTLREKGFSKPIIALTAHAMKEDRDLCIEAGCNDYLTKPIDPKSLSATIFKHLQQSQVRKSQVSQAPEANVSDRP